MVEVSPERTIEFYSQATYPTIDVAFYLISVGLKKATQYNQYMDQEHRIMDV